MFPVTLWMRRFTVRPHARARLVCLPSYGTSADFYHGWTSGLPDTVDVLAAQYPGRGDRSDEPYATDLGQVADALAADLTALSDLPVTVFGHGLGALIGYELALRCPGLAQLAVSGRAAPHRSGSARPGSDEDLVARLRALGGDESLDDPEWRAARLPALHADFAMAAGYRPRDAAALNCRVTVFAGAADPAVTVAEASGWRETTRGPFELTVLPGGHYHLASNTRGLLPLLAGRLDGPATAAPPGFEPEPSRHPVPAGSVPPPVPRPVPAPLTASPRIAALRAQLSTSDSGTLAAFLDEVAETGTPLIEPVGADECITTFVWMGDPGTTEVLLQANKLTDRTDLDRSLMHRLDGTDLWHLSYRLPATWRGSYQFVPRPGTTGRPDPFNATILGGKSVAELPAAPPQRHFWPRPGVAAGTLHEHQLPSATLGSVRRTWVYTPPHFNPADDPLPVLVLLDGDLWTSELPITSTLDNLIADGLLPPLIAVLTAAANQRDRFTEYACHDPFAAFLSAELLPWAAQHYPITADPRSTVIAGQSLGGLAAAHAAYRAPERFGNVISQSGSFWWNNGANSSPEWLTRRFADAPPLGLRFSLEVGTDEWLNLDPTRRLIDVLRAKGYEVDYTEFAGGHDHACWRGGLADRLIALGLK